MRVSALHVLQVLLLLIKFAKLQLNIHVLQWSITHALLAITTTISSIILVRQSNVAKIALNVHIPIFYTKESVFHVQHFPIAFNAILQFLTLV